MRRLVLLSISITVILVAAQARGESPRGEPFDWAVRYGAEFWHTKTGSDAIDIGRVIDRVSHAVDAKGQRHPSVRARTYTAWFTEDGLRFSPSSMGRGKTVTATLRTTSVCRGGVEFATAAHRPRSWQTVGNTAQVLLGAHPGLVEHLESRGNGVEITWVVNKRPDGTGPLTIRTHLDGLEHRRTSASGLHFADISGAARVRISHAVAVDSEGKRWSLQLRFDNGHIVADIPTAVVDSAVYPLAIDPVISPEFGMDEPIPDTGGLPKTEPAIASNGDNFLVVWTNLLNVTEEDSYDIYGARVDGASGTVLDPEGIPICTDSADQRLPVVASNGEDYLVVWSDSRNYSETMRDVFGQWVDGSSGAVDDSSGFEIAATIHSDSSPALSFNGEVFFLAWTEYYTGSDWIPHSKLRGAWLGAASGTVLDPGIVSLGESWNDHYDPAVVSNGSDFLVAWGDERVTEWEGEEEWETPVAWATDVVALRVSGTPGSVIDDDPTLLFYSEDEEEYRIGLASNGMDYLVAWDLWEYPAGSVRGTRLSSATGEALDLPLIEISTEAGHPTAVVNGSDYLVAWTDLRDQETSSSNVYAARVTSAEGAVLDPTGFPVCIANEAQTYPVLATDGEHWLATWVDARNWTESIWASRVDAAEGSDIDEEDIVIASGNNSQYRPQVAAAGNDFLVVWHDSRNYATNKFDIYGARISGEDGTIMDASGIEICVAPANQEDASIASNGSDYLIVWTDSWSYTGESHVWGTLVNGATGDVSTTCGSQLSASNNWHFPPDVASDGVDFLVVWTEYQDEVADPADVDQDIRGVRVNGLTGDVVDLTDLLIYTNDDAPQMWPVAASDGADYLVVWYEWSVGIFGTRVDGATGEVLDAAPIALGTGSLPSISWGGTEYLVVMGPTVISGTRVAANGQVLDSTPLIISQPAENNLKYPDLAAVNGNFLVTWLEEHADPYPYYQGGVIEGTWVQGGTGVVAPDEFLIADTFGFETGTQRASVTSNNDSYLVAYNNIESSADRIGARFVEPLYCLIDDQAYLELMLNPSDPCEQCLPLLDENGWSERDCSELTDQCNTGVCDEATGDCIADPLPVGTPCDDGNPATINDQCQIDGTCAGELPGAPDADAGSGSSLDWRAGSGACTCTATGAAGRLPGFIEMILSF